MAERPIIFSGEMVRALLDDRKTMTRRLATSPLRKCAPGDRLWVREAFAEPNDQITIYRASWREDALARGLENVPTDDKAIRWRPSIHMPRSASRITLEVTAVKIERLQAISENDAIAEGVDPATAGQDERGALKTYRTGFVRIWNELHGPESWLADPEVVAISFNRIERDGRENAGSRVSDPSPAPPDHPREAE